MSIKNILLNALCLYQLPIIASFYQNSLLTRFDANNANNLKMQKESLEYLLPKIRETNGHSIFLKKMGIDKAEYDSWSPKAKEEADLHGAVLGFIDINYENLTLSSKAKILEANIWISFVKLFDYDIRSFGIPRNYYMKFFESLAYEPAEQTQYIEWHPQFQMHNMSNSSSANLSGQNNDIA
ncbi:MAG: hypothetical protein SFT91_02030 [Rickettsiaceae bacterium]|nr:hypothetical protein [Rickettsiaceae bacterium]